MTHDDVIALLKQRIAAAGSQYRFAVETGLHQETVSKVRRGIAKPTDGVLVALGLRRVTTYEPVKK